MIISECFSVCYILALLTVVVSTFTVTKLQNLTYLLIY